MTTTLIFFSVLGIWIRIKGFG